VDLLARLAEDPARAALFLDVDGVLAPIVPRPEDARVPEETRAELRRLNGRYALVACISGRAGDDARGVVGVPELTYVGNHGLEAEEGVDEWRSRLHDLLATLDWPWLEDKGLTAALHYRAANDEDAARARLEEIAAQARSAGFVARFGRKVLEIVPPIEANKGTAVRRLLEKRRLRRALFAGDDTTDLDGFRALNGLEVAVRVAVASDEGPAALREAADVVV
jgi:trehalose 6-phosphate phosphatase